MSVNPPSLKTATELQLQVYLGKNITWGMPIINIQDSLAVDITGAAIVFTVRHRLPDTPALITKAVGTGIVIDPDQVTNKGEYQLSLVPDDTENLTPGKYQMDVQLTLSGKEQTVARGTLEILDVVTTL